MKIKRLKPIDYKIFVVSYDLREGGEKNYEGICEKLKRLGGRHILESVWTVRLPRFITTKVLCNQLLKILDEQDGLYVAELKNHSGKALNEIPHRISND